MSVKSQKYTVNQFTVGNILNWVTADQMAIPEIQRPFVWRKTKIRNLIDSLYKGYPVGYLIAWSNPNVRLKNGKISSGKKILIDGQQRVAALTASILGMEIVTKEYTKERIKISFHPTKEEFEVQNPAILKDVSWIHDIAPIVNRGKIVQAINEYKKKNPDADGTMVEDNIQNLFQIQNKTLGFIELEPDLDIDTVNTIFERVNSAGVHLSQADFAMSKIATYGNFGSILRKLIDYFCHLARTPEFYADLKKADKEFAKSKYMNEIKWLRNENDDLYDPSNSDLLKVAFTSEFTRGKIGDLVSLLSGRNFETKGYEEKIQEETFQKLERGVVRFVNKLNFKKFIMIIRSTGFIEPRLIHAKNTLNFAYAVYLKMRDMNILQSEIESFVRRWFVMSVLTGRYSASADTTFDLDIKNISANHKSYLAYIEKAEMSEAFWNVTLVTELEKSNPSHPFLNTFFASQIKENDKGFLSTDITVRDMLQGHGDMHHIFPKAYIKKTSNSRKDYNQIANFVYTQTEINVGIKDSPPFEYLGAVLEQCNGGPLKYGAIKDMDALKANMKQNCIPESIFDMSIKDYPDFLEQRRMLMAKKIERFYKSL